MSSFLYDDQIYRDFTPLADALNSVRSVAACCEGWSPEIGRALPRIIQVFDALIQSWGWEELAKPEPSRTLYYDERIAWFRENVERPYYEAALSIQRDWPEIVCPFDSIAQEGRAKRFAATMTFEEATARFDELQRAYNTTFRLGSSKPTLEGEAYNSVCQAFSVMNPVVEAIEHEQSRLTVFSTDSPSMATPMLEPEPVSTGAGNKATPALRANKVDPVNELRKKGARTQAALVEYMILRESASFEDIAEHVHLDDLTSNEAIRKNVGRTNESLEAMGSTLRFRVASSIVFKDDPPE
jgi:hypothetical protein